MILRRVIDHFRKQEWTAIAIDFVIVVMGVFVGLQVNNWNDARALKAREIVILERLSEDFARIIDENQGNVELFDTHPQLTGRLIRRIRAGAAPAPDAAFWGEVKAATIVPAPFEEAPTYREMIATGTLSLVASPDVRRAISAYEAARENDLMITAQLSSLVDEGAIDRAVRFRLTAEDPTGYFDGAIFDWTRLKEAEPQLQVIMRKQVLLAIWKRRALDSAIATAAAIGAALERDR